MEPEQPTDDRIEDRADAEEIASTVTILDKNGNPVSVGWQVRDSYETVAIATGEDYKEEVEE